MWTTDMKKITSILLCAALVFGTSGCSVSDLFKTEDTGAGSISVVDDSMYLNLGALTEEDDIVTETYTTVKRGDMGANIRDVRVNAYFPNIEYTNFPSTTGTIRYKDITVQTGDYVKVGDVVGHITVEYDKSPLVQKELELKRMQERYATLVEDNEKSLADYLEDVEEQYEDSYERDGKYDDYTHDINMIYYNQKVRQWENTKKAQLERIQEAEDALKEYKETLTVTEVKATKEGWVRWVDNYRTEGDIVNAWDTILIITTSDKVFISLDNYANRLAYGDEVTLSLGGNSTYKARVLSPSAMSSYTSMQTKNVIMEVECNFEDVMFSRGLTISGDTNTMRNVLLVDRNAVTVVEDEFYVTVVREDGTKVKQTFIPGGSDNDYYWVFTGLEEGTVLLCNN